MLVYLNLLFLWNISFGQLIQLPNNIKKLESKFSLDELLRIVVNITCTVVRYLIYQ